MTNTTAPVSRSISEISEDLKRISGHWAAEEELLASKILQESEIL